MTRKEFSDQLALIREQSGVAQLHMTYKLAAPINTIRRMENAVHNYDMQRAINYIWALNHVLTLRKGDSTTRIRTIEKLVKFIKEKREGIYSQQKLADQIGVNRVLIGNIEIGKSTVTVDVFLKIVDLYGYKVEIRPRKSANASEEGDEDDDKEE